MTFCYTFIFVKLKTISKLNFYNLVLQQTLYLKKIIHIEKKKEMAENKNLNIKINEFIVNEYCQKEGKELVDNLKQFLLENKSNDLYILNRLAGARSNEINCGDYDVIQKVFGNNIYRFVTQLIIENYDHGNDDLIEHLSGDLTDHERYKIIMDAIEFFNDYEFNELVGIDEKVSQQISNSILRSFKLIYNTKSFNAAIVEILTYILLIYNIDEMEDFYNELKTLPTITEEEMLIIDGEMNDIIRVKMDEEED